MRGGGAGLACLTGSVGATLLIMPETVTCPLEGVALGVETGAAGAVLFGVRTALLDTDCNAASFTAEDVAEFDATDVPAVDGTDTFSGGLGGAGGSITGV